MSVGTTTPFLSGAYFDVELSSGEKSLVGRFTSVSGLGMEVEYETVYEGGLQHPRLFFKGLKPQVLVLEQGVVTDEEDVVADLMQRSAEGASVPLSGTITLRDNLGNPQRSWQFAGAVLQKYAGPELNSNTPALAISRMELLYYGCY